MFPFLLFFFYVSYENSRNEDSPNTPLLYLVKLDGRRKYDRFFERGVCLYTYCLVTESSVSSSSFSTGVDGEKTWYFFEETILRLAAPYWASGGIPLILKVCIYMYKLVYDVAR